MNKMKCVTHFEDIQNVKETIRGIPKIIMQTWKTTDVPIEWKHGQYTVQTKFSDWLYVLLTDEENQRFVDHYFPQYSEPFKLLKYPIQRADAIRYMFLYTFGGMYMDLDFEVILNFEDILAEIESPLILIHSGNVHWCLTNSLIICKPHQEVFLKMLQHCFYPRLPWYYLGKHIQVMFSTGPMAFHNCVTTSLTSYAVLPRKLFMPYGTIKENFEHEKIVLKPLSGGTWNSIDSFVLNFLLQYKKEIAWILGILILMAIRGHFYYKIKTNLLMRILRKYRSKETRSQ